MTTTDTDGTEDEGGLIPQETLKRLFAFAVQMAGVPIAALGIANLIAIHYHMALLPLGHDILTNYRLATHLIIGWLYWIPIHWWHLSLPSWFHDVAVISIVSSGVSWRAFAGKRNLLTEWDIDLDGMLRAACEPDEVQGAWDWLLYIISVLPMFFINMFAWIGGRIVFALTRTRPLAGVSAASIRVVLRGLVLLGILILIDHVVNLFPFWDKESNAIRRKLALKYFLYFGVVIFGVIYFFGQLGARPYF